MYSFMYKMNSGHNVCYDYTVIFSHGCCFLYFVQQSFKILAHVKFQNTLMLQENLLMFVFCIFCCII